MAFNQESYKMNIITRLTGLGLLIIMSVSVSCKKGVPPTVETSPIIEVSTFSATCGGTITSEGSSPVIARGVCWAAKLNPTIDDLKTNDGSGPGSYTSTIAGIYGGIAYFVRAYATNSDGTSYGTTKSFISEGHTPSATISPATNISANAATLNGFVNPNGIMTSVIFQYGTSSVYDSTKVAIESPFQETADMSVSANITQLKASTVYHYRIVATNSLGATFSNDIAFTTKSK
jgi:hypothetical protein